MCWQDWKIGGQTRQTVAIERANLPGSNSVELPPNNRRMGLVIHGNAIVQVRECRKPGDTAGRTIFAIVPAEDDTAALINTLTGSRVVTVAEFGNDLRGALYILYSSLSQTGFIEVNQLEWCGPESLDGGL